MDVQRIAHYEIHERLGEGGMGEVWKAFDPKLQRTVAIKILKPALDCGVPASGRDAEARSRLLSEARAASGLNHPNICTIHDVGEAATIPSDSSPPTTRESLGGVVPFIVMEYVEGKPLSELIPADGLPPDTVIRYGAQIADALAHAHEKGIVHRDLKSANIVITPGGRAKVLDFGVADRLPDADAEALTQTFDSPPTIHQAPSLVGTLAYMAPEVLQGAAATARSDIWALGVLLYEMASGRLPFSGTTQTAVIASVVKDSPEALPSKVSAGLRTVAQRCLQKEPGQRYGQAVAVHAVLEALQSGGSATQTKQPSSSTAPETSTGTSSEPTKGSVPWIAVLPFKVQGGGEEIRDLADGLTEDILTGLSQFPYLSVLGADVTVERRGPDMDARALGKAIGARYVIDGRIRASATKLRVNVHLLDTATGTNLWAERFDRALDDADIFDLQDDLTDRIVATIADTYGALARSGSWPWRSRPTRSRPTRPSGSTSPSISALDRTNTCRRVRHSSGQSRIIRVTPLPGPACRSRTWRSTATTSILGQVRSTALWSTRAARWRSIGPASLATTRWRARITSGATSVRSGRRRAGGGAQSSGYVHRRPHGPVDRIRR